MDEHAKKQASLFRKESLSRINSPDKVDEYLRTTNVSAYYMLAAAIILMLSLLIWSAFATLPTIISANGIVENGTAICYCPDTSALEPGQSVKFNDGTVGTVTEIAKRPISDAEAALQYDAYDLYMLNIEEWNYKVTVSAPNTPDGYTSMRIITGQVQPISFLFN